MMQLDQKLSYPTTLGHSVSNRVILSFSTRPRHSSLALGRPRDKVVTKVHVVIGGGPTRVRVARLVNIRVSYEGVDRGGENLEFVVERALDMV